MFLRQLHAEPLTPQVRQDENKPQATKHFPSALPKEKAVRVQTWYCLNNPLMTLIWNDDYMKTNVRKTPLLPTSHITFFQTATAQALRPCLYLFPTAARDKPQCLTAGHRRTLPSLYDRPESWAGVQIPSNCLLFLSSTPRAGLRQNSRKAPCAHPCRTAPRTPCAAGPRLQRSTWAPPHQQPQRCSAAQATPLFGKDEETQPCQCLFWPDWAFPELTEPQNPGECLPRPLKTNTSSSQSLTSTHPRAKV